MAIRIRRIGGRLIAFCAAKTPPYPDDLYLDDEVHHALTVKFEEDFVKMGFMKKVEKRPIGFSGSLPDIDKKNIPPMPKCKPPKPYNDETFVHNERNQAMNQECSCVEKQSLQPVSNIQKAEKYHEAWRYLHEHFPIAGDHSCSIAERVDSIINELRAESRQQAEQIAKIRVILKDTLFEWDGDDVVSGVNELRNIKNGLANRFNKLRAELEALVTENNILREAEAHNLNEIERLRLELLEANKTIQLREMRLNESVPAEEYFRLEAEIARLKALIPDVVKRPCYYCNLDHDLKGRDNPRCDACFPDGSDGFQLDEEFIKERTGQ